MVCLDIDISYHYPPELINLLVETIPVLVKSKDDVLLFFRGAGVPERLYSDIENRVLHERKNINKYEIARTILKRINELGESALRVRREVVKRVVEFEEFSTCYANNQLKARGLVSQVRQVVNVKDSFTRMNHERNVERQQRIQKSEAEQRMLQEKKAAIEAVRTSFNALFLELNPQIRGKKLEAVLNRLFEAHDVLVREAFAVVGGDGQGVVEQIDGVIDLDGNTYLVEMKWTTSPIGVDDVSRHLVRIYHRGHCRGIFISASGYTDAAILTSREALQRTVFAMGTLQEIVFLLERQIDLKAFLRSKINAAMIDKNPFHEPISNGELC